MPGTEVQTRVQIVMSGHQESMVAASLAELRGDKVLAGGGGNASAFPPTEAETQLRALGFSAADSEAATAAVGDDAGVRLSEALDWLCLTMPEDRLPQRFQSGSACHQRPNPQSLWQLELSLVGRCSRLGGESDAVLAGAARPVGLFTSAPASSSTGPATELCSFGYSPSEANAALDSCRGDADVAFAQLFSRLTGLHPLLLNATTLGLSTLASIHTVSNMDM